jgi:hypothetical protein
MDEDFLGLHFMFHCDVRFKWQEYCDKHTRCLVYLLKAFEHYRIVILPKFASLFFLHVKRADFCLACCSTLKTEVTCFSEMLVDFLRTSQHYILEDRTLCKT